MASTIAVAVGSGLNNAVPLGKRDLLLLRRAVDVVQISTGNVEAADHAQQPQIRKVGHNRHREQVVLDKQFEGRSSVSLGVSGSMLLRIRSAASTSDLSEGSCDAR